MRKLVPVLLLAVTSSGCLTYAYEHEIWLNVDGSGRVDVTGHPALWAAFKGLGDPGDPEATVTPEAARQLFEKAGLRVRRVTLTRRRGQRYLYVSAEFQDVNRINGSAAFPDLQIRLDPGNNRLRLEGTWVAPSPSTRVSAAEREGLMAVRFHLPSKVYEHRNAADGVERGNIVAWRQEIRRAVAGTPLAFGVTVDRRSILFSTVSLFGGAILGAGLLLGSALLVAFRRGRSVSSGAAQRGR